MFSHNESSTIPWGEVNEAGELDDRELVGGYGDVCIGISHGGEHLTASCSSSSNDKSPEESTGESLVGVSIWGCNVVQDPENLLC